MLKLFTPLLSATLLTSVDDTHARHHSRRAVLERAAIFAVPPALSLLPCSAAHAAAELTDEQSLIVEAWAVVQRGYVDQQFGGNDWKAIKSEYLKRKYKSMGAAREAIGEMLSVLGDRYTRYLSPGAYSALLAKYERPADNGGIGVTLRSASVPAAKLSQIEIVSIVPGGPAAAAGLQVGDLFETVDGRALPTYATADDVAGLLLGRLEEPVSVSVRRADGSSASFNLRRAVLKQGEVEARESVRPSSGKRIGVLTVPLFSAPIANGGDGGTLASLQAALSSEPLASCQELLIDLRGNPGGHFPSGVEAAKLFFACMQVLTTAPSLPHRCGGRQALLACGCDGRRDRRPHGQALARAHVRQGTVCCPWPSHVCSRRQGHCLGRRGVRGGAAGQPRGGGRRRAYIRQRARAVHPAAHRQLRGRAHCSQVPHASGRGHQRKGHRAGAAGRVCTQDRRCAVLGASTRVASGK